jgi:branched-chain amino acid transport system ATP-binding protein
MLDVDKVTAGYGRMPILHGISLSADEGKVTALVGSNGAGKSTILRAIMNTISLMGGAVLLNGENISGLSPSEIVKRGISLVPEGRRIFAELTVLENLKVGAYVRHDRHGNKRRVDEIFEHFPRLFERRDQMGGSLSGGEQQMLAIGRSLMSAPKLLLLDEPSMGLAPIIIDQVFDVIAKLRSSGTTILLVEQNAERALTLADRAYVLESGRVVLSGTGMELLGNKEVADAYFGT